MDTPRPPEARFPCLPVEGPVPSPPPGWTWEGLMAEALAEARRAGRAGEVPVGAVVADPLGRIVGRGRNAPVADGDPTAHAEVKAIRAACARLGNYRLDGCVLAVELKHARGAHGAHFGAGAAAEVFLHLQGQPALGARLAGIVYGCEDRLAGAVASRADVLDQGLAGRLAWHMGGVLARDCAGLLEAFFAARRG